MIVDFKHKAIRKQFCDDYQVILETLYLYGKQYKEEKVYKKENDSNDAILESKDLFSASIPEI